MTPSAPHTHTRTHHSRCRITAVAPTPSPAKSTREWGFRLSDGKDYRIITRSSASALAADDPLWSKYKQYAIFAIRVHPRIYQTDWSMPASSVKEVMIRCFCLLILSFSFRASIVTTSVVGSRSRHCKSIRGHVVEWLGMYCTASGKLQHIQPGSGTRWMDGSSISIHSPGRDQSGRLDFKC